MSRLKNSSEENEQRTKTTNNPKTENQKTQIQMDEHWCFLPRPLYPPSHSERLTALNMAPSDAMLHADCLQKAPYPVGFGFF